MGFDKGSRLVTKSCWKVFANRSIFHAGIVVWGEESSWWAAFVVATDIVIETVVVGVRAFAAEVPFTGEKSGIARLFERFCEGRFLVWQVVIVGRGKQLCVACPRFAFGGPNVIRDVDASRIFSGHEAGSGRAADLASGVTLGESRAFAGDAVDVRAFVERAAFAAQVAPAEIVGEYEEDIGLFRF